jgi:hypothetical protein
MEIGDTKSLKKAVGALCVTAGVLMAVDFGSYYLGRYEFSFAPFSHPDDGLRWIFYSDFTCALGLGMGAAVPVYLNAKKKANDSKSNEAA